MSSSKRPVYQFEQEQIKQGKESVSYHKSLVNQRREQLKQQEEELKEQLRLERERLADIEKGLDNHDSKLSELLQPTKRPNLKVGKKHEVVSPEAEAIFTRSMEHFRYKLERWTWIYDREVCSNPNNGYDILPKFIEDSRMVQAYITSLLFQYSCIPTTMMATTIDLKSFELWEDSHGFENGIKKFDQYLEKQLPKDIPLFQNNEILKNMLLQMRDKMQGMMNSWLTYTEVIMYAQNQ
jgi:hypothetical protein